ncbi:MAG: 2-amino-4-hydroxy-6-hydroxymethyldihydropteridine diphosphokinase [Gemmatimonadota bacterium]|nr:2-amino-4-hydroxy-6-hydroxymethyldihydropteridine diphosphokinase [Gemmatimonadota bacterium]
MGVEDKGSAERAGDNVFISLGSNLGEREAYLERAARMIAALPGVEVTGESGACFTSPVGPVPDQPDFLNQVLRVSTTLSAESLLEHLLAVENEMGRVRTVRGGPRVIDLDILFYGMERCDRPSLVLPHEEVRNRPFFLEMIREIDSGFLERWKKTRE